MSNDNTYRKHKSGSTEGRTIFRRWRLGGFEYRSDRVAHDYMRRWMLKTPWGMLRLHHILRSDDRSHFHDHPFGFVSLILAGGYIEFRPNQDPQIYRPGSVVVRRAEDLHNLELRERSAWTLLLTTPFYREWGFATEHGWIGAGNYDIWKKARKLVAEFFKGDEEKVALWFSTENPQFGGMVPKDLLDLNKGAKLLETVKQMLAENEREEVIRQCVPQGAVS